MTTTRKISKAFGLTVTVHNYPETRKAIMRGIDNTSAKRPDLSEILDSMTAKQLSVVLDIANSAYKSGKASAGAEMVDSTGLWVGGNYQQIIDLQKLGVKPQVAH